MPPFLVNVVSDGDLWMFALSNGALTAGRRNPDQALFPYYTQDKLGDLAGSTGAVTVLHVTRGRGAESILWEPWAGSPRPGANVERALLKNRTGSTLIFEELHRDLDLTWNHAWSFSARHGVVRRCELRNHGTSDVRLRLLDGVRNVMPFGVDQPFQNQFSNLVDAYKKCELLEPSGIGVYYLSSIPTDRAEPGEGLRSTVVWSAGLEARTRLLSTVQLDQFRRGGQVGTERDLRGRRGAYLIESEIELRPGESKSWWLAADVGLDATEVVALDQWLRTSSSDAGTALEADVRTTSTELLRRVCQVDGLQGSADESRCWRHFSNALFNIMRGGVFAHGCAVPMKDFLSRLRHFNAAVHERNRERLSVLPEFVARSDVEVLVEQFVDVDLMRLAGEYLPLTFSRRHGDPSRPWNRFSIETRDAAGGMRLAYQGNWRDIFQNWEALVAAFPGFTEAAIFRFLNASTTDGHNPYRITQDGFEWETLDPEEPWSNIGYWGDHQIIYLLKLLEHSVRVHPGRLQALLDRDVFAHAHVPYRIRSYDAILADPRATVDYDGAAAEAIAGRVRRIGSDGQMLHRADGSMVRANLAEKLLVPLLAKLSNFVPDGGIWMNTQRPEWNDANNALVGSGISVVTLGYIHRYLDFLIRFLERAEIAGGLPVGTEIARWMTAQQAAFERFSPGRPLGAAERRAMLDDLGASASDYRTHLYEHGLSGERAGLETVAVAGFLKTAQAHVRRCLYSNRREDGLWHAYNLLAFDPDGGVEIERLDEMLEGQVSILSSRLLSADEAVAVLDALKTSRLRRHDQGSYLLYPNRDLPTFLEKNRVPEDEIRRSRLLVEMLDAGDQGIVAQDLEGAVRFNGDFRNVSDLRVRLGRLARPDWRALAAAEEPLLTDVFEATFRHRAFTGRSGTFFAYEGLGSIYWHMVSKLVLAIQEIHQCAIDAGCEDAVAERLAAHYAETLEGLGMHKSPGEYGAFPTDACSHTPAHAGAQQPGMTGQVKEDLLVRWGELGVSVLDGRLGFAPRLLRRSEFHLGPTPFTVYDLEGREITLELPAQSLAFTLCQVPVIYVLGSGGALEIHGADGTIVRRAQAWLTREETAAIFERNGACRKIVVRVHADRLRP
ncbi:MAG TPA: hypothetical protein VGA56_13335 [Opitutaceae bacterium]